MTMEQSLTASEETEVHDRRSPAGASTEFSGIEIGLSAAIIAVQSDEPRVLVVKGGGERTDDDTLPHGAFSPFEHRSLDAGLRSWVGAQTGLSLGYAEQLYTFADRTRPADQTTSKPHLVSIGYLALTRASPEDDLRGGEWQSWYAYFPWEDWRHGRPHLLATVIEPALRAWAERTPVSATASPMVGRLDLVRMAFGLDGATWDEEKVLERYELLFEAGLIVEARREPRDGASPLAALGRPMLHDHRRILATAIGRVRTKIKYRPVIFELMDDDFTLFELQKTVEAILGPHLHKQNFRRLVESAGLVELTGDVRVKTGGRPAKLYRFRREVLLERPAPGVRVKPGRI